MDRKVSPIRKTRRRNPGATRAAILQAALEEFSEAGHSGARVDRIAERAGVSKPMIYDYFGDKNAVYAAALREAYVQIRQGEMTLDLGARDPDEAIRVLVHFTMNHFWDNPWFIRMLNTENLMGGETVRSLDDVTDIQSILLRRVEEVLNRGRESGCFRAGISPAELYIFIASVCWFPISNMHTLRVVFEAPIDEDWLRSHAEKAADMILAYLGTAAPVS